MLEEREVDDIVRNYYELIGVSQTATAAEIKARYRALSKSYHPDTGGSEAQMARLNEAYRILMSPIDRAAHDRAITRERDAARAAAARRAQAAQQAHARTTAKHEAARAFAEQHGEIFKDSSTKKTTKKSKFWKYMAWATGAYVLIGLAVMYVLTMPSTASSDATAETAQPTTSLAQEADKARASIPETPASSGVQQSTTPTSEDPNTNSQTSQQETTTQANTENTTDANTCGSNASDSACDQTSVHEQQQAKHPNWRRLFHL